MSAKISTEQYDRVVPAGDPSSVRMVPRFLRREWLLVAFCACVAVVGLLYNLFSSPDVLYDEAAYTWAAQHVASGWHLTLDGREPLFIHPPLMFLAQAGWLRLTGQASAALPSAIHAARLLSASVGAIDALLIASLAYRLAGSATLWQRRMVTAVVAVLAALDPVLTHHDRTDTIEPFALCTSLLMLHAAWALRNKGALPYVSVSGLLGGLALLTNEIAIFLIVVPLLFALLRRNGPLIRRSVAALGIAAAFYLIFFLWAVELGQSRSFVDQERILLWRLIGLEQTTGLNRPGASLAGALLEYLTHDSSSYILMALGLAALVWCWTRKNAESGDFLTAWLTASYLYFTYIVAVGTLNEQFLVYIVPASIVGSVLFIDALITGWTRRISHTRASRQDHWRALRRLPYVVGAVGCAGLVGLSATSWVTSYTKADNGLIQLDQFIATKLPACAAVNASGDVEKNAYLRSRPSSTYLSSGRFAYFSVGPAALAWGVHYFILAPADVINRNGNMGPVFASWIRRHGERLAVFPSETYKTLQLWYVPASRYDPFADVVDLPRGAYVYTVGSNCGGYTVTDGSQGSFYTGYQALGGKAVVGGPLSRVTGSNQGGYEQFFDGVVLADQSASGLSVQALPIVAIMAEKFPAAYRQAGFPAFAQHPTATPERRAWLTNPVITRAYLNGEENSPGAYAAAVQRYGQPLGPPSALPGGGASQPFANVILEAPSRYGSVHAVPITSAALAAGVLKVPTRAREPQAPPPAPALPGTWSLPAEPTSVEPFVLTLGAAVALYGIVVATLVAATRARRRGRRRETSVVKPGQSGAASSTGQTG